MYAAGATDKMQGTGVWSGLKLSREGKADGKRRPKQKKKDPKRFTPGGK